MEILIHIIIIDIIMKARDGVINVGDEYCTKAIFGTFVTIKCERKTNETIHGQIYDGDNIYLLFDLDIKTCKCTFDQPFPIQKGVN